MGRILCIDYGERHAGIAVSDETKTIAQGLPTVHRKSEPELLAAIRRLAAEHEADSIVVGLPLSQSGKPSTRSEQVRRFAARLEQELKLPVALFDERFSTASAHAVLDEAYSGRTVPTKRKAAADRIAATLILENYLETRRNEERVKHEK